MKCSSDLRGEKCAEGGGWFFEPSSERDRSEKMTFALRSEDKRILSAEIKWEEPPRQKELQVQRQEECG